MISKKQQNFLISILNVQNIQIMNVSSEKLGVFSKNYFKNRNSFLKTTLKNEYISLVLENLNNRKVFNMFLFKKSKNNLYSTYIIIDSFFKFKTLYHINNIFVDESLNTKIIFPKSFWDFFFEKNKPIVKSKLRPNTIFDQNSKIGLDPFLNFNKDPHILLNKMFQSQDKIKFLRNLFFYMNKTNMFKKIIIKNFSDEFEKESDLLITNVDKFDFLEQEFRVFKMLRGPFIKNIKYLKDYYEHGLNLRFWRKRGILKSFQKKEKNIKMKNNKWKQKLTRYVSLLKKPLNLDIKRLSFLKLRYLCIRPKNFSYYLVKRLGKEYKKPKKKIFIEKPKIVERFRQRYLRYVQKHN